MISTVLYIIWIGICIGSAVYIYHNTTKEQNQILWTIIALVLGIIGWLIWLVVGPGQYKR